MKRIGRLVSWTLLVQYTLHREYTQADFRQTGTEAAVLKEDLVFSPEDTLYCKEDEIENGQPFIEKSVYRIRQTEDVGASESAYGS